MPYRFQKQRFCHLATTTRDVKRAAFRISTPTNEAPRAADGSMHAGSAEPGTDGTGLRLNAAG
jgi:hypothetical protein